jgi:hypothetical protein
MIKCMLLSVLFDCYSTKIMANLYHRDAYLRLYRKRQVYRQFKCSISSKVECR